MIQEFKTGGSDTGAIVNWRIAPVAGKSIRVYAFWASNDTLPILPLGDDWNATFSPVRNHDGTTGTVQIGHVDSNTTAGDQSNSPAVRFWPLEPEENPFPYVAPLGTTLTINVVIGNGGPGDGTVTGCVWYDRY